MKRHVMIGIPAYTGMIHIPTMRALMADTLDLARAGFAVTLNDDCGSTYLNDARADMVAEFLASPATDLFFIDWDVTWPVGAMRRILSHPVDVVGGIYPLRTDPVTFTVRTAEESVYPVDQKTGLISVMGLHTGFLRITRAAAEKMVAHYADTLTTSRRGAQIVDLFEPYRIPGTRRKLGDDYSFCQRWLDMGGQCWLDAGFSMGHIGLKMWTGQFGAFVPAETKEAAE